MNVLGRSKIFIAYVNIEMTKAYSLPSFKANAETTYARREDG